MVSISWRNIIRLVLMIFHFLFTIIPLGLCYAQTGDLALVAVHAQAFIAVLVYIPAAFVLAIIDSPSRFTQAGGEVGYLVVQQCLWLPSGAFGAYWGSNAINKAAHNAGVANTDTITAGYQAAAGFGFFQFFLTLCWMIWVIVAVYQVGGDVDETFKVATHMVIDGLGSSSSSAARKGRKERKSHRHKGNEERQEEGTYEEKKGLQDYRSARGPSNMQSGLGMGKTVEEASEYRGGNGYTPVQQGRRDSHASSYAYGGQQRNTHLDQSSRGYQDPYQQQANYQSQQQHQVPRAQYAHSRSASSSYDTAPIAPAQPQVMYAQHRSSTPSLYDAAPASDKPIHPYRQAQMYDAGPTPIAPRPESVHTAPPNASALQSQSRQSATVTQAAIEQPAQTYQSRASQRYLQQGQASAQPQQQQQQQQTAPQPEQAKLRRPSPPWEGSPMSRQSSNESRRSSDLPRIKTNV